MGYGYRSMRPEWKKDWAMEAEFDAKGVTLTLFSSDIWHYNQFYITFEALKAWRASGKFAADADWLRSEFVRQVLQTKSVKYMPLPLTCGCGLLATCWPTTRADSTRARPSSSASSRTIPRHHRAR